jgi:hypothetical protein
MPKNFAAISTKTKFKILTSIQSIKSTINTIKYIYIYIYIYMAGKPKIITNSTPPRLKIASTAPSEAVGSINK